MSKNRTTTIKNTLNDRKPNANTESPVNSSSEDDNIEAPPPTSSRVKKTPTDKQIASITNARQKRMINIADEKQRKLEQNKLISIVYEKQIEEQLKKRTIPRCEKIIEKKILNRLKEEKLKSLMQKYEIQPNDNDSSSEEEIVQRTPKKKRPAPPAAAVAISRPIQKPNIHQLYSQYGF